MSVIYRVIERTSDPRVAGAPKKFYPQLITLGKSVDLKYIAEKMHESSSLSLGDIKSSIQNFVEKLKEQLLEGKTVNIEGLGVFILSASSKGEEKAEDVTANSIRNVRICFTANKELRITRMATRAGDKLRLISLDEYLKSLGKMADLPGGNNSGNPDDGDPGDGNGSGNGDDWEDPTA